MEAMFRDLSASVFCFDLQPVLMKLNTGRNFTILLKGRSSEKKSEEYSLRVVSPEIFSESDTFFIIDSTVTLFYPFLMRLLIGYYLSFSISAYFITPLRAQSLVLVIYSYVLYVLSILCVFGVILLFRGLLHLWLNVVHCRHPAELYSEVLRNQLDSIPDNLCVLL